MYILEVFYFMNILDLNNKIYGYKGLKEEHVDFMMRSIENQEMADLNINNINSNYISSKFNEINKVIKF